MSHGFVVDVMNDGLKAAGISCHSRGRAEAGNLQIQVIEGVQWGAEVEVSLNRKSEALVGEGPL